MDRRESSLAIRDVADIVICFEAMWLVEGEADIDAFLPERGDSARAKILLALAQVDMKHQWESGHPRKVEDYLRVFPELEDCEITELALTEYQLYLKSGEQVSSDDCRRRFGIESDRWSERGVPDRVESSIRDLSSAQTRIKPSGPDITKAALSYLNFRSLNLACSSDEINTWTIPKSTEEDDGAVQAFRDLHRSDPEEATQLAKAVVQMPKPGDTFLGFRLLGELGRGAFGRVYLASQGDLADRPVALKVSAHNPAESQTLAQLQHTNIVPIFSAHRLDPLHAVCMPYFGSTTLKDVFEEMEDHPSIPTSGRSLIETLSTQQRSRSDVLDSWKTRPSSSSKATGDQAVEIPGPASRSLPNPRLSSDTLAMLSRLTYVEAILWIGARLAEGLAHAHGRGILHRDLKPANILMTDSGQPMLLDFNLSEDTKKPASVASIGGTLPYMAPEHLKGFGGYEGTGVDARSDLYSLGIILYELLTGRHPFQSHSIFNRSVLLQMIDERSQLPGGIRNHNPQVSPAVESIVRHCLEPDPSRRYQSASDLLEDLERHRADLPLKHAPEPSIRERLAKWARRHPRLTSSTSVGILLLCVSLGVLAGLLARAQKQARLEAVASFVQFREEAATARYLLNTQVFDRDRRARAITLGSEALERYGLPADPNWQARPLVSALDPSDRRALLEEVGALLLFLAKARQLDSEDLKPDDPARKSGLESATKLCALAGDCFGVDRYPRSLLEQRAGLARLLGQEPEATRLARRGLAPADPNRSRQGDRRHRTHHLGAIPQGASTGPGGHSARPSRLLGLVHAWSLPRAPRPGPRSRRLFRNLHRPPA